MSSVTLSRTHGVNPGLIQCFFCMEASGVALYGRLPGDIEAPRMACLDFEPCSKCQEYMKQGIILVSVRDEDLEKMFHHWICHHCGSRDEVEVKEGVQAYPPLCDSRDCRIRRGNPAMTNKGVGPTFNPYRTGGWVVVSEQFIKRVVHPEDLATQILQKRFTFVLDVVWDKIGLPRGKTDGNERKQDEGVAG